MHLAGVTLLASVASLVLPRLPHPAPRHAPPAMADWMYPKEGVDRVPERPSKLAELAGGPKFPWMPARTEEEVEEEEEAPVMVPEEPEPAPPKIGTITRFKRALYAWSLPKLSLIHI